MMYTLLQMANRVCRNCNLPSVGSDGVTPTNYVTQKIASLNGYLNSRYKNIYESHEYSKTVDNFNIQVEASAYEFTLPKYIGLVLRIVDQGAQCNGETLYLIDPAAYSDKVIAIRNLFRTFLEWEEDTPVGTNLGVSNVLAQPSAASTLTVVSSSTADASTGAVTVFLRGMSAAHEVISESLTTNGLTPVTSANSYLYVNAVTKTGPSVGVITIAQTGGATIATINTWEVSPEYQRIKLEVAPTNPSVYTVTAQKAFVPMLNYADVPAFDCCEAIVNGATQDAFIEQKQSEDAQYYGGKWADDMKNFEKKYIEMTGNANLMLPCGRC